MKVKKLFENWDLTHLKINAGFLQMDWQPVEADRDAAWELYVEMLTRIAIQPLSDEHGDEKSALTSIYSLFPTTREILKHHGRDCVQFSKIAVVVLNQIVRPFTAKWHPISLTPEFSSIKNRSDFREELKTLQKSLISYTQLLAFIAKVEDLTAISFPKSKK